LRWANDKYKGILPFRANLSNAWRIQFGTKQLRRYLDSIRPSRWGEHPLSDGSIRARSPAFAEFAMTKFDTTDESKKLFYGASLPIQFFMTTKLFSSNSHRTTAHVPRDRNNAINKQEQQ